LTSQHCVCFSFMIFCKLNINRHSMPIWPIGHWKDFFYIPSKNPISFTYLISFSISCFPSFQISFVMFICSRFVSASLQCHKMWSVVRFTAQKGHSGLGYLSITAGGSDISSAQAAYDNLLASGHRFGVSVHYVVWFALFHGCGRVFSFILLFLLSSPVRDMFWCGEFLC
jgi:hypothetical protein